MTNNIFKIPQELIARVYEDGSCSLPEYRTEFMRDRDRVLYSTAMRRLAGKTQIYTTGSDDHKRNRLTHTLEVSQIARTLARALHLDEDLAEAIALGHDFGHTPFGHAGERRLHEIMIPGSSWIKDSPLYNTNEDTICKTIRCESCSEKNDVSSLFGFKHNIQSVRVAATCEDSYRDENNVNIGLNLTNYTLWGMQNHSSLKYNDSNDIYLTYQNKYGQSLQIKGGKSEAWSLEGYIVRIADDIAQWHHDLEDAIRGGALPVLKICELIIDALGNVLPEDDKQYLQNMGKKVSADRHCLAKLSHIVVNTLVTDVQSHTNKNIEMIRNYLIGLGKTDEELAIMLYTNYEEIQKTIKLEREKIVDFSGQVKVNSFKQTIKEAVHHSHDVERMNEKGKYIIRKLFEAYNSHPQQLPDGQIIHFMVDIGRYPSIEDAKEKGIGLVRSEFDKELTNLKTYHRILLMRRITDHIAAMTDHYAMEEYNSLYG